MYRDRNGVHLVVVGDEPMDETVVVLLDGLL